jgi:hypothetical protein
MRLRKVQKRQVSLTSQAPLIGLLTMTGFHRGPTFKLALLKNIAKGNDKIPVAFGALDNVVCYACGLKAHKAGDPSCKAGPFDVASSAPKEFRDRREAKKRKSESGSQTGAGHQGSKKKQKTTGEKKPCFDFAKGFAREELSADFRMMNRRALDRETENLVQSRRKQLRSCLMQSLKAS